jgi:hypothetical protein
VNKIRRYTSAGWHYVQLKKRDADWFYLIDNQTGTLLVYGDLEQADSNITRLARYFNAEIEQPYIAQ